VMFTVHANDEAGLDRALDLLERAPVYRDRPQKPLPTFYDTITGSPR
jgi:hypothetical protein